MSIVSKKFDKKETGTVFRHAGSGKILCRLEARLDPDDWNMLQGLIGLVYNAGVSEGDRQRIMIMRDALGFTGKEL
ncbi:hypothetical protein ACXDSS_004405 [Klebsiella quasipneumoniae]|nr:hypothetical protein [Escherichia coli]